MERACTNVFFWYLTHTHTHTHAHCASRCSVNTGNPSNNGTCYRLEPLNCPIGSAFANIDNNALDNVAATSVACMCPVNTTCTSASASMCRQAEYNVSGCFNSNTPNSCPTRWCERPILATVHSIPMLREWFFRSIALLIGIQSHHRAYVHAHVSSQVFQPVVRGLCMRLGF